MKKRQKLARRHTPMGVALRTETRRELVARLLIMSWSTERIARRLGMSTKSIHRIIGTPEFERIYQDLQQQQLKHVDRRLGHLLNGAVDALEKLLTNKDWKARDAALQHIFRIHGRFIDKVDVSGQLDHRSQVRHVEGELMEDAMTDDMRLKARELLSLQRAMLQKSLPARFAQRQEDDPLSRDHGLNGRFLPKEHDPEG
jgi:hypothetical protein